MAWSAQGRNYLDVLRESCYCQLSPIRAVYRGHVILRNCIGIEPEACDKLRWELLFGGCINLIYLVHLEQLGSVLSHFFFRPLHRIHTLNADSKGCTSSGVFGIVPILWSEILRAAFEFMSASLFHTQVQCEVEGELMKTPIFGPARLSIKTSSLTNTKSYLL